MNRRRRPALHLTVAAGVLLLLGAALYVVPGSSPLEPTSSESTLIAEGTTSFTPSGHPVDDSHRPPSSPDGEGRFGITVGDVSGLYPGKMQRIPIVFRNPLPYAISVRTATTSAKGPHGCPVQESLVLRTRHFIHRVIVPPHGSKAKSLRFGMRKTATDPCQRGVFTIKVTASAVRA